MRRRRLLLPFLLVPVAAALTTLGLVQADASASSGTTAPAAISVVGSLAQARASKLSVSPQTVGDLMVLSASTNNASPPTVKAVSGGGVSTWSLAEGYTDTYGAGEDVEIWAGVVSATGPSVITVSLSGYANATDLTALELSAGPSPTWAVAASASQANFGTPWSYPALTASANGQLYYGVAVANNSSTLSGGGTDPVTYVATGLANSDMVAYATAEAGTVWGPGVTLMPSGQADNDGSYEDAVAALISATTTTTGTTTTTTAPTTTTTGTTTTTTAPTTTTVPSTTTTTGKVII